MIFFIILQFAFLNRSLSFHHWSFSGRNVKSFQNRPRISFTARSNNNRLETWQFGFSYISRRNILIENHQLVKRRWKKINHLTFNLLPFLSDCLSTSCVRSIVPWTYCWPNIFLRNYNCLVWLYYYHKTTLKKLNNRPNIRWSKFQKKCPFQQ